jgi:hypothetical protein
MHASTSMAAGPSEFQSPFGGGMADAGEVVVNEAVPFTAGFTEGPLTDDLGMTGTLAYIPPVVYSKLKAAMQCRQNAQHI